MADLSSDVGVVGLIGLGREVDVVPAASLKSGVAAKALAEAIPL